MTKITITIPIYFDEQENYDNTFVNFPQIEIESTGKSSIYQDIYYELTSDENSLREWIRTYYDPDSMTDSQLDELIANRGQDYTII